MATYTSADQIDLAAVARRYGMDHVRLTPLAGGAANSSFRLSGPPGEFVLTVLDNHDDDSAERLARHTDALFRLGLPTTQVVPTAEGSLVSRIDGHPAILKRWLEGEVKDPLPAAALPAAGRLLGRLHTMDSQAPELSDLPTGTRRLSENQEAAVGQFPDSHFAGWLAHRLKRVREERGKPRRSAIAHGDLFADNIVVHRTGHLSVLDWETVSLDDRLLDLGMAVVGLGREDNTLVASRVTALLEGYMSVVPLTSEEMSSLPMEIEHAALIIAFHRYFRHNVRFPDPGKSRLHTGMVTFVESIGDLAPAIGQVRVR